MRLSNKRFWIKGILLVTVITLSCGLIFYRHNVKFEEIGRMKNAMSRDVYNFHPYGFAL